MKKPRAMFFGTSSFALPILEACHELTELVAVMTQPPKPKDRGLFAKPSEVADRAAKLGLQVLTPSRIKDESFIAHVASLQPEVAILAAYGKILPKSLLNIPARGFLNVHPSLLPKYRGPAPIAGALLAGETETGATIIVLDEEMDHGPMLAQRSLKIQPHEHRPSLNQRLAELGATLLQEALLPYLSGALMPRAQDHSLATYVTMLKREDAHIDWRRSAQHIENQIRAFDPWPGTVTSFRKKQLKILGGWTVTLSHAHTPGTVIIHSGHPAVACGDGMLTHLTMQLPGGKPMDADAFSRGHRDFIGSVLGRD